MAVFFDIPHILRLFDSCRDIAMKYYDAPPVSVKEDLSVVTAADCAIEAFLARKFDRPQDHSYMLGEETLADRDETYVRNALQARAWIVDPIDGTAPYSTHVMLWGTSIGLMEQGRLKAGAIWFAGEHAALLFDGEHLVSARREAGNWQQYPLTPPQMTFSPQGHIGISQRCAKLGTVTCSNQVFAWSGCVASCYELLTGRLMAYLVGCKIYDLAGALPIAEQLGFVTREFHSRREVRCEHILEHIRLTSGKSRWAFTDDLLLAPDDEIWLKVAENVTLPERNDP